LFIVVLKRIVCAVCKDVVVVLLSALLSEIYNGHIICYVLCFYVSLLFVLTHAPLVCRCFYAVGLVTFLSGLCV
jgi:hypothetical protein